MNSDLWRSRADLWICLALISATLAVYSEVRHFEFIHYDDTDYVSQNAHLRHGLPEGLKWALTSTEGANWFPLTRLSYVLEYSLFGLRSGGYHLTNLLLHTLASVLLFVFLLRATGARWPSAFVAFLFALHPLHVDSVAWVAERKDVLCAVFWFLTLLVWVYYTERPSWRRYLSALLLFCLGLMSKPMIVTLPFVLLLLDVWPLQRKYSRGLLIEKLPFFALSAGSAVLTFLVQRSGGAVQSLHKFPLGLRIENSLITEMAYIAKTFWPVKLAVLYPYPKQLPAWQAAAAGLVLASISFVALRLLRSRPYLAVGWFWYLGTLLPVIGLVQVGVQARADRYMYVPMVGLAIMLAWGAADVERSRPRSGVRIAALACGVLLALVPVTWLQLQYWQNSETLFRHAIDVTAENEAAYLNLGSSIAYDPKRRREAIDVLEAGLRIDPNDERLQGNLGVVLLATNEPADLPVALDHLRTAVRINPNYAEGHDNLSAALARAGRPYEALDEARAALRIEPESAEAHRNLATALLTLGRWEETTDEAEAALRIRPDYAEAHYVLGSALAHEPDRSSEAIRHLSEAIRLNPDYAEAHNNLGVALAAVPDATFEALFHLEEAVRISPGYRQAQVNLAEALAQLPDRRSEAISHLKTALRIQPDPKLEKLLEDLETQQWQTRP